MKRNYLHYWMLLVLTAALGISGCAATGIYSINMDYNAEDAVVPSHMAPDAKSLQSIISVAEFIDARNVDDRLVLGKVIERDGMKVLVLPKNSKPTVAVAEGLRQYLRKAGYNVSAVGAPWNLQESSIPQFANSRIVIGGRIEDIDIMCRKDIPTNSYTTKIRLTVYIADAVNRRILQQTTVEATASQEHICFSENRMGYQAGLVVGDAIEKLFEKKELAEKIREHLGR